jgi:hypothetical protein
VVQAHGDPAAGEVVADRVVPAGQADRADAVDGAVDLDRPTRLRDAGDDRRRSGRRPTIG